MSLHWFWRSRWSWIDRLTEGGEHLRVDLVGLGEAAGSAGVVAHLAGINDADGDGGFMERRDDRAFPASRRLTDDVDSARHGEQPREQLFATGGIVTEVDGRAAEIDIEGLFGDIETDVDNGNGHGGRVGRLNLVDRSSRLRQLFELGFPRWPG